MKPKILVLSDSLPGTQGGHGIILLKQILYYGKTNFCLFSGARTPKYQQPTILKGVPTLVSPIEYFRGRKINRIIKRIPLLEEIIFFILLQFRKYELLRFVKENKVKLIYAVLRGDSTALVNFIVKKTNLPLVSYIPDTIEAEEVDDKWLIYRHKKKKYYQGIKRSRFLAGPGKTMVNYFKEKFNKESVIFSSVIKDSIIPKNEKTKFDLKEITIGFAGSLYAKDEYEHFVNGLSEFALKNSSYKIKLLFIGNKKPTNIKHVKIEFFNWTSQEDVLKILSMADIGYLPYKFCEKHKKQMTLAFPAKAVSYLALQIPIFFHGPEYSSVNNFLSEYPCGISCNSLIAERIIIKLEQLIFDDLFFEDCKKYCTEAFHKEFSEEKLIKNFNYFIAQGLNHNN